MKYLCCSSCSVYRYTFDHLVTAHSVLRWSQWGCSESFAKLGGCCFERGCIEYARKRCGDELFWGFLILVFSQLLTFFIFIICLGLFLVTLTLNMLFLHVKKRKLHSEVLHQYPLTSSPCLPIHNSMSVVFRVRRIDTPSSTPSSSTITRAVVSAELSISSASSSVASNASYEGATLRNCGFFVYVFSPS